MAKVNIKGLDAEIAMKGYKLFKPAVEARVNSIFKSVNSELMDSFDFNPITQAMESADGTGGVVGYGSLFGFLGFARGSDPVTPVRNYLKDSIRVTALRKIRNQLGVRLKFSIPTANGAALAAPTLPWASESWIDAVQNGVSNLAHYLHKQTEIGSSRSGNSIQVEGKVNAASTSAATPYTDQLIKRMEANLERRLKGL